MSKEDYLKFSTQILPDSYLCSFHSSIGGKALQKFKRGQFIIQASLDLHGYTVQDAEEAFNDFLGYSIERGLRYVLIIHGKGSKAILKNSVNEWLEDHRYVLAFCSAKAKDGGTGAMYVLLKKQQLKGDYDDEE